MKKRWFIEALTYRASSTGIELITFLAITGQLKLLGLYALIRIPIGLIWYVCHKKLWSIWKHKKYAQRKEKN